MGDTQPAAIDKVENTALAFPLYTLIEVLQRFQFESIRPYCPIALLLFKTRLFPAREQSQSCRTYSSRSFATVKGNERPRL